MFLTLLIVTFIIALSVSYAVAKVFEKSVSKILSRVIKDEISTAWERYLKFAIIVVGLSGGVRIWELERYITPAFEPGHVIILNTERWILEVYRTVIGTLQSLAWLLLVFFLVALIGYIIIRGQELKRGKTGDQNI